MFEELYEKIKSEGPVWIWGVGSFAREVEKRLNENEIPVLGHFVDIEGNYRNEIQCKNVETLNALIERNKSINVVVGHGHSELAESLRTISIVKNIWIIPNPYTQYYPLPQALQGIQKKLSELEAKLYDAESCYNLEAWLSLYLESYPWCKFFKNPYPLVGTVFGYEQLQLTENECYIDCGAWDGDTVLQFSKSVGQCYENIVAIEPGDDGFCRLTKNTKNMKNIMILQCALGKEQGIMHMEYEDTQSAYSSYGGKGKKVSVVTIDDMCKNYNISPTVIKIGVPFAFYDILQGAKNIIKLKKPRIIIGVNWDDCSHVCNVIEYLSECGYKVSLRFVMQTSTQLWCYAF